MESTTQTGQLNRLKDALVESEARFHVLFNSTNDAVFLYGLNADGMPAKFLDVNQSACRLLRYAREELLNLSLLELIVPEQVSELPKALLRVPVERHGVFDLLFQTSQGGRIPFEIRAHYVEVRGHRAVLCIARDISLHRYSENLKAAIYRLAEAANSSKDMEELFHSIHLIISELIPAQNFYIALHDDRTGTLSFPYFVDQNDEPMQPRQRGRGLTEYVLRTGKPLLAPPEVERALYEAGEVDLIGAPAEDWLGVPLNTAERTIGVLVIQSYTKGIQFGIEEQNMLMFVSHQIASVIERRSAEDALRQSEERYRAFVQQSSEGIWRTSLEVPLPIDLPVDEQIAHVYRHSIVAECNDAMAQMYGFQNAQELVGTPVRRLHVTSDPQNTELQRSFVTSGYRLVDAESHELDRDSNPKIFLNNSVGILENGFLIGVWGTQRDITGKRKAEKALLASEERYRLLFERNLAGVFRSTVGGKILDCNESFARMLGYGRQELMEQSSWSLYAAPRDREAYVYRLKQQFALSNVELRLRRKDGSLLWVLENVSLLADQYEGSLVMEGTAVDITDRKKAEDQIAFQAYHDALTGLPNRNLFSDRLSQALAHAARNNEGLAVLFLDLDHFKLINDTLGHTLGDWLLVRVAERLRRITREVDTVARLGGDEFIMLLPGVHASEDAARVAQKILATIDDPFQHENHELFVTTSVGISFFPADGEDPETLIRSADNAMYRAKELGRNNYHLFSPALNQRAQARLSWERDLRRAVDREEFVLYYQPQIQLQSGRITGLEALIRWKHPDKGLVMPGTFIPVAEETRLIFPIAEWALHEACRQLKEWQDLGYTSLHVSINLSARQFQHEGLIDFVLKTLDKTRLSPRNLILEITESIAMQNVDLTLYVLKQLREHGIRIALDDFGVGYSSLSYLKHFPVDIIKIDTSFVRDVGRGREEDALVRAVIQIGANLQRLVIAEGVETPAQRGFLLREGCEQAQGFLFSPAVPPEDFLALLKQNKQLKIIN